MAQGGQFKVNTYTTDVQSQAVVAMNAGGDFVVAWQSDNQDGDEWGTYAQRYSASGATQGLEFRVNTITTGTQYVPDIAMDADGDFVIAWRSGTAGGSIYAQRFNAAGVAQGVEFQVSLTAFGPQAPTVAMDADGDFVVAWWSIGGDGSGSGIYARRYDASGVAQSGEFRVNTYTTSGQRNPSVAMDDNGDFVVTWENINQDGFSYGVYAQRYNTAGAAEGDEFRVNTYTTGSQLNSSVAMDADGDFIIAWQSGGDGFGYGVFAQAYNAAGAAQGGEFRVNTTTSHDQGRAAVAMDADGNAVITWDSNIQDGSFLGVYAQRYAVSAPAPAVSASTFLYETAPQGLSFTFDQDVSASLGTDDVLLENLTSGQTIPSSDLALSYELGTNTATFRYTGPGGLLTSVLPDGNYRATLIAAGITNGQGVPLAANHVFTFFFLNGDANRDGRVTLPDFNILAANFGLQSGATFSMGDFNYDGRVTLVDFNILASRFGTMLAPPGASSITQSPFSQQSIDEDDALSEMLA